MASKINELDVIALLRDIPEHDLRAGQTGTVVYVHNDGEAYEVEFPLHPRKSAIETVKAADLLKLLNLDARRAQAG
ncbi:MAG: DUF4926 domain-containing protein [Planctomycetota bacterium]|nr:DUF4926 domain-containing protein [Planctomycetota bacterium]